MALASDPLIYCYSELTTCRDLKLTIPILTHMVLHTGYPTTQASPMNTVTVSPKFQVVIPKNIRDMMGIISGQKIEVVAYQDRIELIPIQPMKKLRGFLKDIDTTVTREKDR